MPDEPRLREQAREAIKSGKLPSQTPNRTWGGPGIGAECSVGRKAILPGAERIRRGPTGMHIECEKTKHYLLAEPERYRPRDHPCAVGLSALCWQGQ
jgi:biotin operon repressor